jgi:hypothetical protein
MRNFEGDFTKASGLNAIVKRTRRNKYFYRVYELSVEVEVDSK